MANKKNTAKTNVPVLKDSIQTIFECCFPTTKTAEFDYTLYLKEFEKYFPYGKGKDLLKSHAEELYEKFAVNFEKKRLPVEKKQELLDNTTKLIYDFPYGDRNVRNWLTKIDSRLGMVFKNSAYLSYVLCDKNNSTGQQNFLDYFNTTFSKTYDFNVFFTDSRMMSNKDLVIASAVYILLKASGNPTNDTKEQFEKFDALIKGMYKPITTADKAKELAEKIEKTWLKDACEFIPRTDNNVASIRLTDIYVHPEFENDFLKQTKPLQAPEPSDVLSSTTNRNAIVMAKTGAGKTVYLRMLSVCLARRFLPQISTNGASQESEFITELSEKLKLPDDMYVIYIPAYMFTLCRNFNNCKKWTDDFVKLYFHAYLEKKYNFDKKSKRASQTQNNDDVSVSDEVYNSFVEYISEKAKAGKLVLIADSFDEIPSGDMRDAYITALKSFKNNYCKNESDNNFEGGHIICATRRMSKDTMEKLKQAVGVSEQSVYGIKPLSREQQEAIIDKWKNVTQDKDLSHDILNNGFSQQLSENPYMLSALIASPGKSVSDVVNNLISKLLEELSDKIGTDRSEDIPIRDKIRELAFKITVNKETSFFLSESNDLFENVNIDTYTIHVGIIVPAEGTDDKFQFINDILRLHLAAEYIKADTKNFTALLDSLEKAAVKDYAGVVTALLGMMKTYGKSSEMIIRYFACRFAELIKANADTADIESMKKAVINILGKSYDETIVNIKLRIDDANYPFIVSSAFLLRAVLKKCSLTDEEREIVKNTDVFKKLGDPFK